MTINDSAIRSSNMSPSGPFRRTALGRLAAARSGTSFRRPLLCCTYGADLLCCNMGAEQVCGTVGAEQRARKRVRCGAAFRRGAGSYSSGIYLCLALPQPGS
jgi:hypothetical protein